MSHRLKQCVHLYIGCETNKGKFVGMKNNCLFIETSDRSVEEYTIENLGKSLFLHLHNLDDLTDEQRQRLIGEGVLIGRPFGYTFSTQGFLYLLGLQMDLFGLINAGLARNLKWTGDVDSCA